MGEGIHQQAGDGAIQIGRARDVYIGTRRLPSGAPFQAPTVPRYFVPRPEVSQALMDYLTADAPPGALVVSAVHGLGGIGKTTLVAALAHTPDVQTRFPDGVLWVTLGQQPDVLSLLAGWIQALGDYDFRPTVLESVSAHLRTLLHDKACLLVVDDAWHADHVRPFLVGGPRCRLVVTTRNAVLARKVGARLYDLDVMTEAQALSLFQARLGPLDGDREQAVALARELGYLPLALELAAAQVEAGLSWAELLDAFRQALADLATLDLDEATYRNESLRLSFRLSLEQLSPDDQEAFAWLGVLPEDAHLNPAMAATLWGEPEADARKRLRRLRDRALVKSVGDDRYTLHDLLHDEAKLRLAEQMPLPEAHAALLGRYRVRAQDGLWHTLPHDGYIHEHLTWHMEQAGQPEAIHALLQEEMGEGGNAWYEAREALGQTSGYLDDVRRAWRLSEEDFAIRHSPLAIGLQCRYALITATIRSMALNIPPTLLVALVKRNLWTPGQGLAFARRIPNEEQRVETLAGLAECVSVQLRDDVLGEALAAAQAIQIEENRAVAIEVLAPHLSEPLLRQAILVAQESLHVPWREYVLPTLLQRLAELGYADEALDAAAATATPSARVEALRLIAPHLSEESLLGAIAVARAMEWSDAIEWDHERMLALAGLAAHLPNSLQREVLQHVMTVAQAKWRWGDTYDLLEPLAPLLSEPLLQQSMMKRIKVIHDVDKVTTLLYLASHLPESLLQKGLEVVQSMRDPFSKAQALVALAPYLPRPMLEEALAAAQRIWRAEARAYALTGLVPCLPEPLREPTIREALSAVQNFDIDDLAKGLTVLAARLAKSGYPQEAIEVVRAIRGSRAEALARMAPYLPRSLLDQALDMVETMPQPVALSDGTVIDDRAKALEGLASHLSSPQLKRALAAVQMVCDEDEQALMLSCLAPYLPEGLLAEAIEAVSSMGEYPVGRIVGALRNLTPYLPEPLLQRALALARARGRQEVWRAVLPHLPESVLEKELAIAQATEQESGRVAALTRLAPYLPKQSLRATLAAAQGITDGRLRAALLAALAPRLAQLGYHQRAFSIVQAITDDSRRHELMAALIPDLPEPLLLELLEQATTGGHELVGYKTLAALTLRLAELEYQQEAVSVSQRIGWIHLRAETVTQLVPHLSEPLKREAVESTLAAARSSERVVERAAALAKLAPHLPEVERYTLLRNAWDIALALPKWEFVSDGEYSWRPRPRVLVALVPTARFFLEPEFHSLLRKTLLAVQDLPERGRALATLAPFLPEPLLEEALAMAEAFDDEHARGRTLGELVPHLPEPLLPRALATGRMIKKRTGRYWVLRSIGRRLEHLPAYTLHPLWSETLHIAATRTRRDLLADLDALSPVIAKLGGEDATVETFRAIQDVGRWWP